jgi:hypothetical protein
VACSGKTLRGEVERRAPVSGLAVLWSQADDLGALPGGQVVGEASEAGERGQRRNDGDGGDVVDGVSDDAGDAATSTRRKASRRNRPESSEHGVDHGASAT